MAADDHTEDKAGDAEPVFVDDWLKYIPVFFEIIPVFLPSLLLKSYRYISTLIRIRRDPTCVATLIRERHKAKFEAHSIGIYPYPEP